MRSSPALSSSGLVRLELGLLAAFSAIWLLTILAGLGVVPLAGTLNLDLYRLYSIAAVLGWVSGNIYVQRSQSLAGTTTDRSDGRRFRKRLLLSYLIGPPSVVYFLRALAPYAIQKAAPVVPIYSFCVYGLFFLVPLTLRATRTPRRG